MFNLFKKKETKSYDELHTNSLKLSKQLDTMQKISKLLISGSLLDASLDEIIRLVPPVLGVNYIGILLLKKQGEGQSYEFNLEKTSMPEALRKFVEVIIGKEISNIPYVVKDKQHVFIKSVVSKKIEYSDDIRSSFIPIMSEENADRLKVFVKPLMKLLVSVPLIVNNEVLGVIALGWKNSQLSSMDENVLNTFANQVGIAIYNARLFTQVKTQIVTLLEQNKDLSSLFNLTSNVSKSLDPKGVAQMAVDSLPQDEFMIGGIMTFYNPDKNVLEIKAVTMTEMAYQAKKITGEFDQYPIDLNSPKSQNNASVKAFKLGTIQPADSLYAVLTPSLPEAWVPLIEKILKMKYTVSYPLIVRNKTIGTITYYLKTKGYHELDEGKKQLLQTYTSQIAIALDNATLFSRSQEIQTNLEEALEELQERRRFEQDMIDVMGHELRTPMSIIRNALSMMEMDLKNKGEISIDHQKKYVDMGIEATRREVSLIETLLSATKADAKGFQLLFDKVDLLDVINDALEGNLGEAQRKQLEVVVHEPPNVSVDIYSDRTRIQEVMDNFLSNAIKYTQKGTVEIIVKIEKNFAWVSVKDTGIGISSQDLKKLGQKFFRAQQYTDDENALDDVSVVRPGGTGLGLYVAFSLIRVLDGKLDIQSKVGEGSTFTFAVPLYKGQKRIQVQRKTSEYFEAQSN